MANRRHPRVPEQWVDRPELMGRLAEAIERPGRVALVGFPGTGKSSLAARLVKTLFRDDSSGTSLYVALDSGTRSDQAARLLEPMRRGQDQVLRTRPVTTPNGCQWCQRIWTVLATCAQQGRCAFAFLLDAVQAHFSGTAFPSLPASTAAVGRAPPQPFPPWQCTEVRTAPSTNRPHFG